MSPKKSNKVQSMNIEPAAARKKGVQDFGVLVPAVEQFKFSDHPGEVFYIVKLEKKFSDNYGDGYVVHVKDFPNAAQIMTCGVYGAVPGQQLDALFQATNGGSRISLDSPVAVKIEQVPTKKGMSYRFVSPNAA